MIANVCKVHVNLNLLYISFLGKALNAPVLNKHIVWLKSQKNSFKIDQCFKAVCITAYIYNSESHEYRFTNARFKLNIYFFPLYGKVDLVDNVLYFHETNVTVQIILLIVKIGFDFFKKPVIVDLVMFLTGIRRFTQKHFLMQVTGQCIEWGWIVHLKL